MGARMEILFCATSASAGKVSVYAVSLPVSRSFTRTRECIVTSSAAISSDGTISARSSS